MLDPDRTLTQAEKETVRSVRDQIGIPKRRKKMSKVIPQGDVYNYLYDNFKDVRGFTAVKGHTKHLNSLKENIEGARLDYNDTKFKITRGIDGISQKTGEPDKYYGVIEYRVKEPGNISVPYEKATPEDYPFTGRGFTGSKKIVLPEYYQSPHEFKGGEVLRILDSENGNEEKRFIFDNDVKTWITVK